MTKRRVVVTGLGTICPLGLDVETTWQAILNGESGVGEIDRFDPSDLSTRISASVRNFQATDYINKKEARRLDEFVHFAIAASDEAIQNSGLQKLVEQDPSRVGIAIGSGIGGMPFIELNHQAYLKSGPKRVSPFFIPGAIVNMSPGYISMRYGIKGPNISVVTACTTGAHNIGYAARTIAYGDADAMIAGGSEMATTALGISGFSAARALSTRNDEPEKASRPWDQERDGFVLGEGAGVLVLEEYETAKKRGAPIYAELAGFGMSADAYHMTAPDENGQGFVKCMSNALDDAKLDPQTIDYVNAHGTSTPAGDRVEAMAVKQLFADHAYELAMSSSKSMTGHLLGAAGSVESIISILALRDNVAPPTINLDQPDDDCDLNLVPNYAQQRRINAALSNSFGFGGTNASLVFSKVD